MKKILTISLCLVLAIGLSAANRWSLDEDNYHFGYFSAGVGYSSLSHSSGSVSAGGGVGWLVGGGYEFRRHDFWVSAGVQIQQLRSSLAINEYSYTPDQGGMDDLGRDVTDYTYTINQRDAQNWLTFDIPVMAGYYHGGFYIGAGLKASFPLRAAGTVTGTYDIDADYDRYVGIVSDVHYYTEYDYDSGTQIYKLRPLVSVMGEVGYDLLSTMLTNDYRCHVLKLGMFFEFGLSGVKTSPLHEPVVINPENITDVTISPYLSTERGVADWTVPYIVGLKLTYMIGGSRNATTTWHKGCQCYGY